MVTRSNIFKLFLLNVLAYDLENTLACNIISGALVFICNLDLMRIVFDRLFDRRGTIIFKSRWDTCGIES